MKNILKILLLSTLTIIVSCRDKEKKTKYFKHNLKTIGASIVLEENYKRITRENLIDSLKNSNYDKEVVKNRINTHKEMNIRFPEYEMFCSTTNFENILVFIPSPNSRLNKFLTKEFGVIITQQMNERSINEKFKYTRIQNKYIEGKNDMIKIKGKINYNMFPEKDIYNAQYIVNGNKIGFFAYVNNENDNDFEKEIKAIKYE
ncbi:hypothetical protein Q4595_16030 [Wenyingzhuangia sp. 1_MG-2023]|nr:hypothetical protein [Wenyingzhuangia sp. 1_MG-2023]